MKYIIHVHLSLNNIIISVTDHMGNVICWASGGSVGFKGFRRSTTTAVSLAVTKVVAKLKKEKIHMVSVFFKGIGKGSELVVDLLEKNRIDIDILADVTEIPHNGCRPRKKRRL
uniref:30S ribosomal protein S11 n=1 Tax=Cyanidiococcus yangmingshanensis TaxID=2690220 RepID=A0A7G5VUC4_9RHOD|nr:30S ribosomal protein S11 [Cyanidiococcus yangmingshanensis]QMX77291.1 30S ribosomal protein S11 [Cyanidiococcus yangmingshanensis]